MLQTYISSDNQHIKKQKLISTAVLLENPAALSLEWVECKRKICLFERVPTCFFNFHLLMCDSSAPFRLNALKHCIFRMTAAALIALLFKRCQGYSGWRSFD